MYVLFLASIMYVVQTTKLNFYSHNMSYACGSNHAVNMNLAARTHCAVHDISIYCYSLFHAHKITL